MTLLVITPVSPNTAFRLTPVSARFCNITLDPFSGLDGDDAFGNTVQMTGNGKLLDLTPPQLKDIYQTTITCTDLQSPQLDRGYRGALVQIDFSNELSYPTGGSPAKPLVSGSSVRTLGSTKFYRPSLLMRITMIKSGLDERPHKYSWMLKAIETKAA